MTRLLGVVHAGERRERLVAAKPASHRYDTHEDIYGTPARQASRIFRCHGGRHYIYLGGWGCDYYVYSYDWPYRRRR